MLVSYDRLFEKHLRKRNAFISVSVERYKFVNPLNLYLPNARIRINDYNWYGDIDLTIDLESLKKISKELKKTLYIYPDGSEKQICTIRLSSVRFFVETVEKIEGRYFYKEKVTNPSSVIEFTYVNKLDYKLIKEINKKKLKQSNDPLDYFWGEIKKKTKLKTIDVSTIYVTSTLFQIMRESIKNNYFSTNKDNDEFLLEQYTDYVMINYGPQTFPSINGWMKTMGVYLIRER